MKFGGKEVPGSLREMALDRMRRTATFTPEEIREHLLKFGRDELKGVTEIEVNQWIIANRVYHAARKELVAQDEVEQLKKGVWAKRSFMTAAGRGTSGVK